jgi:hypothetical protein
LYSWLLCCLFFFDIRILIAPLVSSNSSCYHWVDVTAGGQFVPGDIIRPVAIKCMNLRRSARILALTSPSIERSEQDGTMDMVSSGTAGVLFSQDMTNNSVIRNSDHHTNNKISNLRMRPCSVQLHDILDFNDTEQHCLISKCRNKNCKTCNILITETNFTSNLTNKNYFTRNYDDLNYKSANVVYGLECNLCGLVYVGVTKGKLHKRRCCHRSSIINNVNDIVYQHFNQPDHSILCTLFFIYYDQVLNNLYLINLTIRFFQCEFVSSKKYTIGLTIQT